MTILYSGFLGLLWGLATLLYEHSVWKVFKLSHWIVSLWLAFLVAWLMWEFIPHTFQFRDWLLWMSWAVWMAIMRFIQTSWVAIITAAIQKFTGIEMPKTTTPPQE